MKLIHIIVMLLILILNISCSQSDVQQNTKSPNKQTPTKQASTEVQSNDTIQHESSFLGEWVGFGGKRITISKDGMFEFDQGKSRYRWTLKNRGQMILINQKKTPPQRWKRGGMATSELMKDSFNINVTSHTLELSFINKRGFSHNFLNLLRLQEEPHTQLKDLQGEWDKGNNEVWKFIKDTLIIYYQNKEYERKNIELKNGCITEQNSSRRNELFYSSTYPFLLLEDTLKLLNSNMLIKRKAPFQVEPHFIAVRKKQPPIAIHQLMYCDDILSRLSKYCNVHISPNRAEYEYVYLKKKQYAMIDSLLKTGSTRKAFKGYTPIRLEDKLYVIKNTPLPNAKSPKETEIEYSFFCDSPTAIVHLTFEETVNKALKDDLEATNEIALFVNEKYHSLKQTSGTINSSRRTWYSIHQGTMSFTYTHDSLENWQNAIKHMQKR